MRSRDVRFVRVSIMAQGGDCKKHLDVDKASTLLTQHKSEFEKWIRADRPAIEKAALRSFSAQKRDARNGQSVTVGFTSSNWSSLCVTTVCTIMMYLMIVSFAFLMLVLVIRLLMCTRRLQNWHLSRYGLLQSFESDVKDD